VKSYQHKQGSQGSIFPSKRLVKDAILEKCLTAFVNAVILPLQKMPLAEAQIGCAETRGESATRRRRGQEQLKPVCQRR
jgi:hypothetical protein